MAELEASAASGVTDLTRGDIVISLADLLPELALTHAVAASVPRKDIVMHEPFVSSATSTTYRSFWRASPTAFKLITSGDRFGKSLLFSPEFKAFRREVLIHASLKHSNITAIIVRCSLANESPPDDLGRLLGAFWHFNGPACPLHTAQAPRYARAPSMAAPPESRA